MLAEGIHLHAQAIGRLGRLPSMADRTKLVAVDAAEGLAARDLLLHERSLALRQLGERGKRQFLLCVADHRSGDKPEGALALRRLVLNQLARGGLIVVDWCNLGRHLFFRGLP